VWDLETRKLLYTLEAPEAVHAVAFSPDGRRIASACYGHTVSLRNADTGKEAHRFADHQGQVYDIVFSLDGRLLAASGGDKTVRVWRLPQSFMAQVEP